MQSAQASGVALEDAGAAYGRLLGSLADAERFPAIHAVLAARAFDPPGTPADDVQFGLDRILDGIEVLVRARRLEQPRRSRTRSGRHGRARASRKAAARLAKRVSST